jgi:N utilization substance protein B
MGARHSGRQAALQMLFALDVAQGTSDMGRLMQDFWRNFEGDVEGRSYADAAAMGVFEKLGTIDEQIRTASENWRIERMARVDRNILRLATWELMHQADVPKAVILDEAVELAKSFGTEESPAFINGVLSRVAVDLKRTA